MRSVLRRTSFVGITRNWRESCRPLVLIVLTVCGICLTDAFADDKKCNPTIKVECPTQIKAGLGTGAEGLVKADPDDPKSKDTDDRLLVTVTDLKNCGECVITCVAKWTEGTGPFKSSKDDHSVAPFQVQAGQPINVVGVAKLAPADVKVDFEITLTCGGEEKGEKKKCPAVPVVP